MFDANLHGQSPTEIVEYTVYSDFTCAECYGLNEQLVELGVSAAVHWRGVQIDPTVPAPMRALDRRSLDRVEDEIAEVRRRVDGVLIHLPRGKPNTLKAIVAVASVMRQQPARAAVFRDALYRAYWRDGTDLSSAAELQRVADAAAVPRFVELDHPDAEETVEDWDLDWATERLGGVPRVIRGDGKILWGLKPTREVSAFFEV